MTNAGCTPVTARSPMLKSELRQHVRAQVRQYTDNERTRLSQNATRQLLAHPKIKSARVVMMYWPLPDEVDVREAVRRLYGQGKTVLLPESHTDGTMTLRRYEGDKSLHSGLFHIMEPWGTPFTHLGMIDAVVVPGMAFDHEGHRLGHGQGYYDRFLPKATNAYLIGMAFSCQLLSDLPTEPHDRCVDEVITDE